MTLYGAFEITALAAFGGWALWLTATQVLKRRLGRQRQARAQAGAGCSSGCGGCASALRGGCGVPVAPPATHRHD